jgi:spore germination protein YaaH
MHSTNESHVKLSGWFLLDDDGSSLNSLRTHAGSLECASTDWIHCRKDGSVVHGPHPTADERIELKKIVKRHGLKIYAMAVNEGFSAEGVEAALASPASIAAHVAALVKIAVDEGADGIDLDYESLNEKDRGGFTQFVKQLADALHSHRLRLVMAIHAKESEPGTWGGPQAQEYAALGRAADSVRVMTYDEHWNTSEAGPISSPDWVARVMAFAATQIPPGKLELGIAAYGYDWLGKKGDGIGWTEWAQRVAAHGPAKRDAASQELVLTYDGRTAYFVDGEAARPKLAIVRQLGLHGLAMWRLGSEDPGFWPIYDRLSK